MGAIKEAFMDICAHQYKKLEDMGIDPERICRMEDMVIWEEHLKKCVDNDLTGGRRKCTWNEALSTLDTVWDDFRTRALEGNL